MLGVRWISKFCFLDPFSQRSKGNISTKNVLALKSAILKEMFSSDSGFGSAAQSNGSFSTGFEHLFRFALFKMNLIKWLLNYLILAHRSFILRIRGIFCSTLIRHGINLMNITISGYWKILFWSWGYLEGFRDGCCRDIDLLGELRYTG